MTTVYVITYIDLGCDDGMERGRGRERERESRQIQREREKISEQEGK